MQVVFSESDGVLCLTLQFVCRSSTGNGEEAVTVHLSGVRGRLWCKYPFLSLADLEFIAATVNRFLEDSRKQTVPDSVDGAANVAGAPESADSRTVGDNGAFGSIPFARPQAFAADKPLLCDYQGIKNIARTGGRVIVTLRRTYLDQLIFYGIVLIFVGFFYLAHSIIQPAGLGIFLVAAVSFYFDVWKPLRVPTRLTLGSDEWSLVQIVPKPGGGWDLPRVSEQRGQFSELAGAKVCSSSYTCDASIVCDIVALVDIEPLRSEFWGRMRGSRRAVSVFFMTMIQVRHRASHSPQRVRSVQ
jgi:hypothetical protein